LWDLTTGQEVLSLAGPTDIVTHVAFTPDGRRLVSATAIGGGFLEQLSVNTGASELAIWDASEPAAKDGDAPVAPLPPKSDNRRNAKEK
jgi:WD40 repeat protein